mmetsp:Transcript_28089/g.50190  ORF Transcript_28089/g.50190 Transcript_28089/m.50190 type:complete len:288 (+) Transcript_28089:383-1246(+)
MRSPMPFMAASFWGHIGRAFAGVSANVSTLRLISCREVISITRSETEDFSNRGLRLMSPVEIARLSRDDTMTLSPASPRMMDTTSSGSSSSTGRCAVPGCLQPVGWEARKVRSSQPCFRPTSFRGESKNSESRRNSMSPSLIKARTSLKGRKIFQPLLKTAFHSDSPWRMKTIFIRRVLAECFSSFRSSGFRGFLSLEATKYQTDQSERRALGMTSRMKSTSPSRASMTDSRVAGGACLCPRNSMDRSCTMPTSASWPSALWRGGCMASHCSWASSFCMYRRCDMMG